MAQFQSKMLRFNLLNLEYCHLLKLSVLLLLFTEFQKQTSVLADFRAEGTIECVNVANDDADCRPIAFVEDERYKPLQEKEVFHRFEADAALVVDRVYPPRAKVRKALKRYDELPYPIPVGPTMYFSTLFLVLITWYIKKCIWRSLHKTAEKIELYPETNQFPKIQLYSLQQSKREARLRREARNTWAWMSQKYLLKPNDPKVNTRIFQTTWSDFDLPKDVWGIVRAVMKVNALFTRSKKRIEEGNPIQPKSLSKKSGLHSLVDPPTIVGYRRSTQETHKTDVDIDALNARLAELRKANNDKSFAKTDVRDSNADLPFPTLSVLPPFSDIATVGSNIDESLMQISSNDDTAFTNITDDPPPKKS